MTQPNTYNNNGESTNKENHTPQNLPNYDNEMFSSANSAPSYVQPNSYPDNYSDSIGSSPETSHTSQNEPTSHNSPSSDPYEENPPQAQYNAPEWTQPGTASSSYSSSYSAPNQELNIKALLGLIFSFIFFPVGLILSWMGYNESKNTNDSTGKTLSLVGLIVSGIQLFFIVLWFVFFVFIIILGSMA